MNRSPEKIVVIDDDLNMRQLLHSMLSQFGYTVTEAENGMEGLELVEREQPDLVMVDLCMPGMDGADLVRRLSESHPTLPVIVISGKGTMHDALGVMRLGAWDYLQKPFSSIQAVAAAIRRVCEKAHELHHSSQLRHNLEEQVQEQSEQLHLEEYRYRMLFESAHDAIILLKEDKILNCNKRALQLFACSADDEMLGRTLLDVSPLLQPDDLYSDELFALYRSRVLNGEPQNFDWRFNRTTSGSFDAEISLNGLEIAGETYMQALVRDMTEHYKYLDDLYKKAHFDDLTGLPNRHMLGHTMAGLIENLSITGGTFHLFLLGINKLKHINDTLGHSRGDELLVKIGQRLKKFALFEHALSRFIGNEFMLLSTAVPSAEQAASIARQALAAIEEPFLVDNIEIFATASVGICSYPQDGDTTEVLLQNIEAAMNQAKREGSGSIQFFDQHISETSRFRHALEHSLHRVLERDELLLYFQPQIAVGSGEVVGMETLLRWQCPERGLVPPVQFIPVLEESGMIIQVGHWLIHKACQQLRQWIDAGLPGFELSINVSPLQFLRGRLVESVRTALQEYDIHPSRICLELTESLILGDLEQSLKIMHQLVDLGVSLSIDDFGTGYSSLSYLSRMPIHELKIDRSFVIDIPHNPQASIIVDTILGMASCLGLRVVAEGVETAEQCDYLSARNCSRIQGYYYSKPLSAAGLEAYMRERIKG